MNTPLIIIKIKVITLNIFQAMIKWLKENINTIILCTKRPILVNSNLEPRTCSIVPRDRNNTLSKTLISVFL
jgi:hypothetical protein